MFTPNYNLDGIWNARQSCQLFITIAYIVPQISAMGKSQTKNISPKSLIAISNFTLGLSTTRILNSTFGDIISIGNGRWASSNGENNKVA